MTSTNELIKAYRFKSVLPYPHQVRALQRALDLKGKVALFMEPGTGKTRVSIDYIGIKHQQGAIQKVLVVCPKVAMAVWQDQIDEYLPRAIKRQAIVLDNSWGTVNDRIRVLKVHQKVPCLTFIMVNYDVMASMREDIRKWRPDCIILDECHYIKKHSSARSRAVHYLANVASHKLILSGTPITNSPKDIFSQYKFLDADIFGTRWGEFKSRYCIYGGYGGFTLIRYKNLDKLQARISLRSFEATKDEMDLPDKLPPQVVKIPMSAKTRKLYEEMDKEFIAEIEGMGKKATAAIILTKMIRLRQITGGFVRIVEEDGTKEDVGIGREKLDALGELLDSHCREGGYKVVVFAVFKWEVAQIKALCDSMGIDAIKDEGNQADRRRFRDDPKARVYIVPLAKGGIAVNELVAAHIGIFYSMDHSSDHIIQAMDRLHRPGQSHNVFYQFLAVKGTIDLTIYKSFVENKNIADELIYKVRRKLS